MSVPQRFQEALHRAVGLENDGKMFEAEQLYRQLTNLARAPDLAHYQYAQFLLRRGDYNEAWPHYMKRLDDEVYRSRSAATLTKPYLKTINQEALRDQTVLVYCDQGIGDAIMCARYVPLLAELSAGVVLTVFHGFRELFSSLGDIRNVTIIEFGEKLPPYDVHADILSLPAIFATTPENIPPADWMKTAAEWQAFWAERIPAADGLNIGLAWQGSAMQSRDEERSAKLASLRPLFETAHRYYSLQAGPGIQQVADLPEPAVLCRFEEIEADIDMPTAQMVKCAALINQLDLVITVDTAIGHLAGALGKPVWILTVKVPYWVYMLEGERTPWYPSARLFRTEERYNWDGVIARMVERLQQPEPLADQASS